MKEPTDFNGRSEGELEKPDARPIFRLMAGILALASLPAFVFGILFIFAGDWVFGISLVSVGAGLGIPMYRLARSSFVPD